MSRWEPLAAANPVPGEPEVLTDAATYYAGVADAIDKAWRALGVIEDASDFTSDAVDALREKTDDVRNELQKASTRYAAVATALTTYAVAHHQAQQDAEALLTRAKVAQVAVDDAERAVLTAQDNYDDAVDLARTTGGPVDSSASWMLRSQISSRDTARSSLSLTVGELDGIVSTWRTAARTAAGDIREGVKASDLNDGWWEEWGSNIAQAVSSWAGDIAMWAGIAALVLGWVPVLGQVLAVVALLATVAALIADFALAVKGEGPWLKVVLGAVTAATFGLGRLFGAAAKAKGVQGLAQGAARQRTVVARAFRFGNPRNRTVASSVWTSAQSGFRTVPVTANPVTWFKSGIASFSGLKGRAWVMNFLGHGEAARAFQALSNTNVSPHFWKNANGIVDAWSHLGSLNPVKAGSFASVVVPFTSDLSVATNGVVTKIKELTDD